MRAPAWAVRFAVDFGRLQHSRVVNHDGAGLDLICHYASFSSWGRVLVFSALAMSAASRTDAVSRGFAISLVMSASSAGLGRIFVGNLCVITVRMSHAERKERSIQIRVLGIYGSTRVLVSSPKR